MGTQAQKPMPSFENKDMEIKYLRAVKKELYNEIEGVKENHRSKRFALIMVILLLFVSLIWIGASVTTSTANWFDETGITNGVGQCHYIETAPGGWVVVFDGTFDSASVTLQSGIRNLTGSTPCAGADLMKDVAVPGLVEVVAETAFVGADLKSGYYRVKVENGNGAESINLHWRK